MEIKNKEIKAVKSLEENAQLIDILNLKEHTENIKLQKSGSLKWII